MQNCLFKAALIHLVLVMLSLLLSMVTGLLLWFYGIRVAVWVFCLFFRHGKNSLKKYQDGSRPSWAIVTGATSGIGLAFCEVHIR